MPHSSGGGSHGGGFHSSSSHSGSGNTSAPRISRRPYAGARRYIYYYPRTGRYVNLYYQGTPKRASLGKTVLSLVALALFFCMMASAVISDAFYTPKKTDLASYNARIVVADSLGVMEDMEGLTEALEDFQTLTGVTPSVEVVGEAEWEPYYSDLETFALSEYLRLFDDEKHWLFVISLAEGYDTAQFVDWHWEGMIGDEVEQTINETSENTFTELFQTQLLRMEGAEVDQALIAALEAYDQVVMEPIRDYSQLTPLLIMLLIFAAIAAGVVGDYKSQKRLEKSIPVQDNAKEASCEYCGCMYVVGTISSCPHCGAPIPAAET